MLFVLVWRTLIYIVVQGLDAVILRRSQLPCRVLKAADRSLKYVQIGGIEQKASIKGTPLCVHFVQVVRLP